MRVNGEERERGSARVRGQGWRGTREGKRERERTKKGKRENVDRQTDRYTCVQTYKKTDRYTHE